MHQDLDQNVCNLVLGAMSSHCFLQAFLPAMRAGRRDHVGFINLLRVLWMREKGVNWSTFLYKGIMFFFCHQHLQCLLLWKCLIFMIYRKCEITVIFLFKTCYWSRDILSTYFKVFQHQPVISHGICRILSVCLDSNFDRQKKVCWNNQSEMGFNLRNIPSLCLMTKLPANFCSRSKYLCDEDPTVTWLG